VDTETAQRLLALNRQFYTDHGRDFSATRERLQTGVMRVLNSLRGDEAILDLGCGNGGLARTLSRRNHSGSYLGLDFSLPLLNEAGREAFDFPVQFAQADIARLGVASNQFPVISDQSSVTEHLSANAENWKLSTGNWILNTGNWSLITAFAILHHIPSFDLRLNILKEVRRLLKPNGLFIHSNWQFLNSERLKARIQSWNTIGLTGQDVDPKDYLLDWKRGGLGLRYVHHFDEAELAELAKASGFEIIETFYSDGENKKLSLYQIWKKA